MKKILLILISILSTSSFSQMQEVLKELNISLPQFNDVLSTRTIEIEHPIFSKLKTSYTNSGEVKFVNLTFNNINSMNKNTEYLLKLFINIYGQPIEKHETKSGSSYFFEKGLEKATIMIYNKNLFEISSINLNHHYPEILMSYDEFTKNTHYEVNGLALYEKSQLGSIYDFQFHGVKNKDGISMFMYIHTENKEWKFIDKIYLLVDGVIDEFEVNSTKKIDDEGKTIEVVIISLKDELVKRIINGEIVKIRVSGEVNDDMIFNQFMLTSLRKLYIELNI